MQLSLQLDDTCLLQEVRDRLLTLYGPQRDAERHDPLSQLIKAIMSSCTVDAISQAEFCKLHAMVSWEVLPDSKPATLAAIFPAVTRPAEKAAHIVGATGAIRAKRGSLDLDFLKDWPVNVGLDWLDRLPGVGSKIAAVVLNFSTLRKPAFVVDRHILRWSKRAELVPIKADYDRGFRLLSRILPVHWDADDLYELHWLLKMHGQSTCTYDRPACGRCPLKTCCPYGIRVCGR